jgi:hypothetical protein
VDRDPDETCRLLEEIAEGYGASGMYAACCALAETVRQFAFPSVRRGDGTLTGEMLVVEQMPGSKGDPRALWACRFVASYINGDSGTSIALFYGSVADEDAHTGGVIALLALAASLTRQREASTGG